MRLSRKAGLLENKTYQWLKYSFLRGNSQTKTGNTFYGAYKYTINNEGQITLNLDTKITTSNFYDYKYTNAVANSSGDFAGETIYEVTSATSNSITVTPIIFTLEGIVKNKDIFAYPLNGHQGDYYYILMSETPSFLTSHSIVKHVSSIEANYNSDTYKTQAEEAIGRAISSGDQSYTSTILSSGNYRVKYYFDLSDLLNTQITQVEVVVRSRLAASTSYPERLSCYFGNRSMMFDNLTSTSRADRSFTLPQTSLGDLMINFYVEKYNYSNYTRVGYLDAVDVNITYLA